jgi:hypothetical protein
MGLDHDSFFHQTALELADGNGYVGRFDVFISGEKEPTADHPPLYPLMLFFLGRLGARSADLDRMLGVCAGTHTVVAVGLVARQVAGYRAGLTAAAVCAVYPAFIAADGALMLRHRHATGVEPGAMVAASAASALRTGRCPPTRKARGSAFMLR